MIKEEDVINELIDRVIGEDGEGTIGEELEQIILEHWRINDEAAALANEDPDQFLAWENAVENGRR